MVCVELVDHTPTLQGFSLNLFIACIKKGGNLTSFFWKKTKPKHKNLQFTCTVPIIYQVLDKILV